MSIAARRRRGFTLLEMMVATALMAIVVVGMLSLLSSTLGNAARVKQYDQAAMLARTEMNELLTMVPLPVGETREGQWGQSSGWKARVEPFERPANAQPGATQLVRIDLEVWWEDPAQQRKSLRFEGYRQDIIREGFQ